MKSNTMESLKCFDLEHILEAKELEDMAPEEVNLEEYDGDVVDLD